MTNVMHANVKGDNVVQSHDKGGKSELISFVE